MKKTISDIERKVLAAIQGGFPRSQTPYQDMAEQAGISTETFLSILKNWKREGKLRRIGSIVDHVKVGLPCGAMVVWRVEPTRVEEIGAILAGFSEVSHAYERDTCGNWPYNVYTMVHGADIRQVEAAAERMSRACGISDYRMLTTLKELKKVAPTYIPDESRSAKQ
jgi:DNA-binding Lrp family transcriptional regulator